MATVHPSRLGLVPRDPRGSRRSYRSQSRSRSPQYSNGKHRSRSRSHERDDVRENGRRSPHYGDYKKPEDLAPWKQQENMYPERRGRQNHGNWGGGGSDYLKRFVMPL